MGMPKRSSPAGKKISAKKRRERNRMHHKDPEIERSNNMEKRIFMSPMIPIHR